jgi:hypothetical protein
MASFSINRRRAATKATRHRPGAGIGPLPVNVTSVDLRHNRPTLEQPRRDQDAKPAAAFREDGIAPPRDDVEAPIAGSENVSRAGPMLLVLPLHGRALRPIGRALDPWKLVRRMLPNTARDPMRRPAASSGPTYDRPGQPSGPLRVRGLTGEANDQAWFSPFAGSR